MLDVKQCLADCEERMEMSVMHLEDTLAQIRAGKANIHILDDLRVNSYGSMVPINNVAAVSTPDARTIAIKPWDKQMFRVIEKSHHRLYHRHHARKQRRSNPLGHSSSHRGTTQAAHQAVRQRG